ncbi:HTH cro/C1-type domain-containing protein OS=Streptomyces griseomycini OX=66895 GN=FHS37_003470 PE=4 SV=1 [Streptomyces griseomycini]
MAAKPDYHWHLRKVTADRGMFSTSDLLPPLAERGITLSTSQVCLGSSSSDRSD